MKAGRRFFPPFSPQCSSPNILPAIFATTYRQNLTWFTAKKYLPAIFSPLLHAARNRHRYDRRRDELHPHMAFIRFMLFPHIHNQLTIDTIPLLIFLAAPPSLLPQPPCSPIPVFIDIPRQKYKQISKHHRI